MSSSSISFAAMDEAKLNKAISWTVFELQASLVVALDGSNDQDDDSEGSELKSPDTARSTSSTVPENEVKLVQGLLNEGDGAFIFASLHDIYFVRFVLSRTEMAHPNSVSRYSRRKSK
jgi:hypothetical protein